MRLAKYLASAGVASRRRAEIMIREGLVKVNGRTVIVPQTLVSPDDKILVGESKIELPLSFTYILLHKPPGYLTTMKDQRGRPTVNELLDGLKVRVYPVGRLDRDVSGVLLFTNDGELAHRLAHPRYGVRKTYRVKVRGILSRADRRSLREGIMLEEGRTAPAGVSGVHLDKGSNCSIFELTLVQGWKRQVKRMCRAIAHPVISLERICFAFLGTGKLPPGGYRHLNASEVARLRKLAGLKLLS